MPLRSLIPLLAAALLAPGLARAHCDTLDGPVVSVARAALDDGKLEPVLAWVQARRREGDPGGVLERARRAQGREGGEGARRPLVLRDARPRAPGRRGGPVHGPQARRHARPGRRRGRPRDRERRPEAARGAARRRGPSRGCSERWAALRKERPPAGDVAAGRRWVAAYVPFVHWAEAVNAAAAAGGGHEVARGAGRPGCRPPHAAGRRRREARARSARRRTLTQGTDG